MMHLIHLPSGPLHSRPSSRPCLVGKDVFCGTPGSAVKGKRSRKNVTVSSLPNASDHASEQMLPDPYPVCSKLQPFELRLRLAFTGSFCIGTVTQITDLDSSASMTPGEKQTMEGDDHRCSVFGANWSKKRVAAENCHCFRR